MTLKSVVADIFAPQLEKHGFALTFQDSRYYCFENVSTGIQISLTVPPRCPFELLDEHLKNLEKKRQGGKDGQKAGYVSLGYSVKLPDSGYVNLAPSQFESCMGVTGDFAYCNDAELEQKTLQTLNETVTTVIPFLEQLSNRFVGCDGIEELEDMLASDPAALAQKAAEKFDLPSDRMSGHSRIEPALFSLRGPEEANWKRTFYQHFEEIAGLAAYLSECIAARSVSAEWVWEAAPEIQTADGICESSKTLYFSVQHKNGCEDLNLIQIICDLWNFHPFLKCRHIPLVIRDML